MAPLNLAVLWDFDGTLGDSTELILTCYRHTMQTHLGRVPPEEDWLAGFGKTLDSQIARYARSPDEATAMLATYRDHQHEYHDRMLRPFPEAAATVAELTRRGIPQAIVTSKSRELVLRGLERCGLHTHLPTVVAPEDVVHPKPHPEPVLRALEQLRVDAERTLLVGDSPHDIAAGVAAGVRTAAALWGPFPRPVLEAAGPHLLLERPSQVLQLVRAARA